MALSSGGIWPAAFLFLAMALYPAEGSPGHVVCYYSSWAHYRKGLAKYTVEDIPVDLCTHLIYAFATMDSKTYLAKPFDPWLDIDLKNYEKFVKLKEKNPAMKVLLGVGGWNDSRSTKYSIMVADAGKRRKFVKEVVKLLLEYGFDGLDLDWEYPGYESRREDKQGFTLWVEDLKTALSPHGLLLTTAVSASRQVIDKGYDIPKIMEHLDFVNLMAYDFHGSWERVVAHHSPLYPEPGQNPEFNADFAVNYWIQKGAPAHKIVLGVPFYGRSWTLSGSSNSPGSPASGAGRAGKHVRERGHLAYFECCLAHQEDGWTKVTGVGGPYLTKEDQWVGYDDIESVVNKAQYARDKGLGGIMIWDTVSDDFSNSCGHGTNPLLTAIYRTLQGDPPPIGHITDNQNPPHDDPFSNTGSRPSAWNRAHSWKQPETGNSGSSGTGNVVGDTSSVKGSTTTGGDTSQNADLPYDWLAWPIFSNDHQGNQIVQTNTKSETPTPSTSPFSNKVGDATIKGSSLGQTTKPPYDWLSWPLFSNTQQVNQNGQSNKESQFVTPSSTSSTSVGFPSNSQNSNKVGGTTNKDSGPTTKNQYDWQSWPIFNIAQQTDQTSNQNSPSQSVTTPSTMSSTSSIFSTPSRFSFKPGETTNKVSSGSGNGSGQTTKQQYDWQAWPIFSQSSGDNENSLTFTSGPSFITSSSKMATKSPFSPTSRFSLGVTTTEQPNRFGSGSSLPSKPPYKWLSWPAFHSNSSANIQTNSVSTTRKPISSFSKFSSLSSKFPLVSSALSWFDDCKLAGFAPDPTTCSAFYRCTSNHAYKFDCPGGLLWNQDQSSCDWPNAVQCILPVSKPNIAPFLAPESLSL